MRVDVFRVSLLPTSVFVPSDRIRGSGVRISRKVFICVCFNHCQSLLIAYCQSVKPLELSSEMSEVGKFRDI